jgi:hypothetical protein
MTKNEFERLAENYGLGSAIADLTDERILDFDDMKDLIATAVYDGEFGMARSLLSLIDEDDMGRYWLKKGAQHLPQMIEGAEDVAFLLDDDEDEWLPDHDDGWCNRRGIM